MEDPYDNCTENPAIIILLFDDSFSCGLHIQDLLCKKIPMDGVANTNPSYKKMT